MAHKPCLTAGFLTVCCYMSMLSKTPCSQSSIVLIRYRWSYILKNCSHFSSQGSYYDYTHTYTTEVMSLISGANECQLCIVLTWRELNYTVRNLYHLWTASPCLSWSAVAMHTLAWVVFAPGFFTPACTLAVALQWLHWQRKTTGEWPFSLHEIFKCTHLKYAW